MPELSNRPAIRRRFRCRDQDCGIATVEVCWQPEYRLGWPTRIACPGCHQLMRPITLED